MIRTLWAMSLAAVAMVSTGQAGDPGCGCQSGCCMRPVCRIVCEMKEVKETCYCCECEDFCVPGRSQCVGCHPECDCCGCVTMKPTYKPCWCDIFHRKKLVKKEIVKKVPHYKCVIEYVCDNGCGCGCHYAQTGNPPAANLAESHAAPAGEDNFTVPPQPVRQPLAVPLAGRQLPPPPLPDVEEAAAESPVRQASHAGSTLRLKLK
ncbi:MAG: hypothetical protein AB7O62_13745 [Pirellulales bacterium]